MQEDKQLKPKPLAKPLAMMPSLKRAHQIKLMPKRFPLPPGLIVELGLFCFSKLKHILAFMQVSKLFRKECKSNNRLWYFVHVILSGGKPDEIFFFSKQQPDYYKLCIEEQMRKESQTREKLLTQFRLTFVDSWKRKDIR